MSNSKALQEVTKDLTEGVTRKANHAWVGLNFLKTWRKRRGDKDLYEFIKTMKVHGDAETLGYIKKFKKEYESKIH